MGLPQYSPAHRRLRRLLAEIFDRHVPRPTASIPPTIAKSKLARFTTARTHDRPAPSLARRLTSTGKTHFAIAIARCFIRSGAHGRLYNVVDLVNRLGAAARISRQGRIADHLTRLDFVVLNELAYLTFSQASGQLLFHLVTR